MSGLSVPPPLSGSHPAAQPALSFRPWWARLAAAFALACGIWLLVKLLAFSIFGEDYSLPSHTFRAISTCLLVFVALLLLLRWEHTRPADYGVGVNAGMARGVTVGALSYLVPFFAAAAIVLILGLSQVQITGTALVVAGEGITILALVILYEAIPEELIFRGYLFRVLSERLPGWATIFAQALLFCAFGAAIGAVTNIDRLLLFFFFALSLGYLRQVTGTVFATIGFHAIFQTLAQWALGEQWPALSLTDPHEWFALIALGLAPFLLAPVVAAIIVRFVRADR